MTKELEITIDSVERDSRETRQLMMEKEGWGHIEIL